MANSRVPKLITTQGHGWRHLAHGGLQAHVHLAGGWGDAGAVLERLALAKTGDVMELLAQLRRCLYGHWAVLIQAPTWCAAITDIIASKPIYIAHGSKRMVIGSDGFSVAAEAGLAEDDIAAARHIGAAGYTVGRRTVINGLEVLKPGEIAVVSSVGIQRHRYATYLCQPDEEVPVNDPAYQKKVADLWLAIVADMARSVDGRPIVIPLSTGLDSRAIAAALKEVGHHSVSSFSYGLPGNHEAEGARRVAQKLGIPWRFVPFVPQQHRAYFQGEQYQKYVDWADRPDSMPFVEDVPAISALIAENHVPDDAVFVNGQAGDYITGNHIPAALRTAPQFGDPDGSRAARIFDAAVDKHFDLWASLRCGSFLHDLKTEFFADLSDSGLVFDDCPYDYAFYELSEYENRQAKYVAAMQRGYEFLGHDWRMPLWDARFVEFWRTAPLSAKYGQALYRRMLESENWGGVWGPEWEFEHRVIPFWLRPVRLAAKLACAPLGKRRWHRVEKRLFDWPSHPTQAYAIVPYRTVALERRGHRNALSYHAEAFLARVGFSLDDLIGQTASQVV